jgi:ubiquinone/menaquinone biosynthesis C-methylase UbiE
MAQQLFEAKLQTYDLMRVRRGHHILDFGCGAAVDTPSLATLVGPRGRVYGVDSNPKIISEANERVRKPGQEQVIQHIVHNILDMSTGSTGSTGSGGKGAGPLPWAKETFHSCRAERILQHLPWPGPEIALQELARVTKSGGRIVLMDMDWSTVRFHSSLSDVERKVRNAYVHAAPVHNPQMGGQLSTMVRACSSLTRVTARPVVLSSRSFATFGRVTGLEMPEFLACATTWRGCGLFSEADMEAFVQDLQQSDERREFWGHVSGWIVVAQKN